MRAIGWLLLGAACGCSVKPDAESAAREERPACSSDAQCGNGQCLTAFGICSQNKGDLTLLLFEVIPPASDPVYAGARFLTLANLDPEDMPEVPGRGIGAGWREINVRPRVPVSGSVYAAPDQTACLTRARRTLPVTLTFTPRERLMGLSVPSYELVTRFDAESGEYTFQGLVPPGNYDVYMRPNASELDQEGCVAVPQIFRDRSIGEQFELAQPPPSQLRLSLPWRDELEGWVIDMVHPVTGETISNRVQLSAASRPPDAEPGKLRTTLYYSRSVNERSTTETDEAAAGAPDPAAQADELVRLTPPSHVDAGTVLLQRSGIEVGDMRGEGEIADVFQFGKAVDFRAWVWKENEFDAPVPGSVSFTARDLDAVPEGVPTAFDRSAMINERGEIQLRLLPGRYRVRVTPPGTPVDDLGLLAGSESTVTVLPNETDGLLVQAGGVIEVPASVSLSGRVLADVGGAGLEGVEVRASASPDTQVGCSLPGDSDTDAACAQPSSAVLRQALAQDPFVPRTRSTESDLNGDFRVAGLDCGQCEPGAGARFDLSVRPAPELGLPWLVRRGFNLFSNEPGPVLMRVPAPVAHALRFTYGDPAPGAGEQGEVAAEGESVVPGLADALVRVYALLDERALLITDPSALVPCLTLRPAPNRRCVQSVLQVAELRSGPNGESLLLLPPSIK